MCSFHSDETCLAAGFFSLSRRFVMRKFLGPHALELKLVLHPHLSSYNGGCNHSWLCMVDCIYICSSQCILEASLASQLWVFPTAHNDQWNWRARRKKPRSHMSMDIKHTYIVKWESILRTILRTFRPGMSSTCIYIYIYSCLHEIIRLYLSVRHVLTHGWCQFKSGLNYIYIFFVGKTIGPIYIYIDKSRN